MNLIKQIKSSLTESDSFDLDAYKKWLLYSASELEVDVDNALHALVTNASSRDEALEFVIKAAEEQAKSDPEQSEWADDGSIRSMWEDQDAFFE